MRIKHFIFIITTMLAGSRACLAANAANKVDCRDLKDVAHEAVAYSLLAAWENFANHACFKGEKFKYFKPELAKPEGEVTDASQFKYFDRTKDSYKILGLRTQRGEQLIDVEFTLGGKPLRTTYTYLPDPDYQAKVGVCGYVVNWQHSIFRADCVDKKALR